MVAYERRVGADAVLTNGIELGLGSLLAVARLLAAVLIVVAGARLVDRVVEGTNLGVLRDLHLELRLGEAEQHFGPPRVVGGAVLDEPLKNRDLLLEKPFGSRAGLLPPEPRAHVDLERGPGWTPGGDLLALGSCHPRNG